MGVVYMSKYPKLMHFVSEIDQFLQKFDAKHPVLSTSQEKEVQKYDKIYFDRDNPNHPAPIQTFWEAF